MSNGRRLLITGGAGFVGVNAAHDFARQGWDVTVYDNLSRAGTARNLSWLTEQHPRGVRVVEADVRDQVALRDAVEGASAVIHLAAQVAVTTSMTDPRSDFDVNALGTFNVLEALRIGAPQAPLVFASTNKVYGALEGWTFAPTATRWQPEGTRRGIAESEPLDFHSPYGCSKGAADQYVRDYTRCYGLRTVVLRQSCIYGAHQYGNEDQGWVAHFAHAVARRQPITIYGDGRQVRDLLDVRDLCHLYRLCIEAPEHCAGRIFNVGGGPANARSVIEVLHAIEALLETDAHYTFADWRPGDQVFYVSDIEQAGRVMGWHPEIRFERGLEDLARWVMSEQAEHDPRGALAAGVLG